METEKQEFQNEAEKKNVIQYEYAGYQIRICFAGERTFAQCIKKLAERRLDTGYFS